MITLIQETEEITENKTSYALKEHLKSVKVTSQLALPDVHRNNAEERAMLTFKTHFMSILCGLHSVFMQHHNHSSFFKLG